MKRRVFVVESDRVLRKSLVDIVKTSGYEVIAFCDNQKAMNFVREGGSKVRALAIVGRGVAEGLATWASRNGVLKVLVTEGNSDPLGTDADAVVGEEKLAEELPTVLRNLIGPPNLFD